MYIKPCPHCHRLPKITEGVARNGHRFYMVGCPNYCWVLRPDSSDYWSGGFDSPRHTLHFNDDIDYNTMYKKWNEELIDGNY